ncbi:reverse transcriptase domain-containing protein, partial [Tanacetum coccineum]
MPIWCHMFNSTLTGKARVWFDDLPKESIDSYDDLKKAFLENYLQQKKCIKDLVKIHSIRQRDGESTEEFVRRLPEPTNVRKEARSVYTTHKTPKEIFALDKGKFKAPPPMTTPVEKRNQAKFCKLHGEVGHNTDECMHLRKQIEEMLKAGKLSHLIKDLKQNNGKEQPKVTKKRETSDKDKALTILKEDEGTEGPMIIEAEIGGHCIHRMYVDGGSALEILYEHCFSRFCPKIKNKLIPATTPLIGFSGEVIWPIGQIQVLVKIKDKEHSASAWMNFVVIRSPSLYNMIIGRLWVRKLQAVPSTAHGMLKISVEGGVITLKSSKLVPLECAMVSRAEGTPSATKPIIEERVKVSINPEYSEQTVMIGSTLTEEGRNKDVLRLGKKRGQAADRNQAIQEEVKKLVKAGIM